MLPEKLHKKLSARKDQNSLRSLPESNNLVDFSSNDYLGVVNHNSLARVIQTQTRRTLKDFSKGNSGATGSRLLTGNHILYEKLEAVVSRFHESESALIFNSGYTANLGFFQSVPQRGDIILYDELAHASIRDGLKMSDAKAYKFEHNSLHHLSQLLKKHSFSSLPLGEMSAGQRGTLGEMSAGQRGTLGEMSAGQRGTSGEMPAGQRGTSGEMPAGQRGTLGEMHTGQRGNSIDLYVVTESVFSMDGDSPDLVAIAQLCKQYNAKFVVDEAHAVGVLGIQGQGLVQLYGIQKLVFARLVTFGKAAGAHGAAILGSNDLKEYLINFARPFIYTTALPPHTIATILSFYTIIEEMKVSHMIENVRRLKKNINIFRSHIPRVRMDNYFVSSVSAIQCAIIPGVDRIKTLSRKLKEKGYDLKPILPPTVPEGTERLRFCLHSYNTKEQIHEVLEILQEELT